MGSRSSTVHPLDASGAQQEDTKILIPDSNEPSLLDQNDLLDAPPLSASGAQQDDTKISIPNCNRDTCLAALCFFSKFAICLAVYLFITMMSVPQALDPEFGVHSAVLWYPHNATRSSDLTATWDLTLLATNPNDKWDIYCHTIHASLFYGPGYQHLTEQWQIYELAVFAATSLPPLFLTSSNQTSVSFKLPMLSAYIGDDLSKEIFNDNITALSLRFGLKLSLSYRYYSVSLNIGRPAKIFELDIDSGSDLTQVQCDAPCTGCTKEYFPLTFTNGSLLSPHQVWI
ncbi:uncharacterized protein Pyn_34115 [Prunus yedoensis var. nudiflora]|uniref:Peptidase A1 domain-containing protein n=1 Tax=Prunus yedoensis var. nudiflora TaxID=2094558 RepID=A0A314Z2R0_PRUYE|nr:uncharacterized protein Pyn_34115 [Prunus yedoensis var. nudiflora]